MECTYMECTHMDGNPGRVFSKPVICAFVIMHTIYICMRNFPHPAKQSPRHNKGRRDALKERRSRTAFFRICNKFSEYQKDGLSTILCLHSRRTLVCICGEEHTSM